MFNIRSARHLCIKSTLNNVRNIASQRIIAGGSGEKFGGVDYELFRFFCEQAVPFMDCVMHPRITFISRSEVHFALPFNKLLVGNPVVPCLHGGVLATMIDHAAGACVWASLDDPHLFVNTVDLQVDYLIPAPCEELLFVGKVEHRSPKLIRSQVTCTDAKHRRIAIGRACYNIYRGKEDAAVALKSLMEKYNSTKVLEKNPP